MGAGMGNVNVGCAAGAGAGAAGGGLGVEIGSFVPAIPLPKELVGWNGRLRGVEIIGDEGLGLDVAICGERVLVGDCTPCMNAGAGLPWPCVDGANASSRPKRS